MFVFEDFFEDFFPLFLKLKMLLGGGGGIDGGRRVGLKEDEGNAMFGSKA